MGRGGRRVPVVIAWLAGGALPLAATPLDTDPVAPSRLVLLVVIVCLGLVAPRSGALPRDVAIGLAGGMGVFAAAGLAGATPTVSLLGRHPRYEGVLVVAAYAALVWIGAVVLGPRSSARDHVRAAMASATIVLALVAIWQVVTAPGERVTGLVGNSTTLGTWGVIALAVLGWGLLDAGRARAWWLWAGVVASVALVVLSASRGAQVAAVAVPLVAALLGVRSAQRPRSWVMAAASGMVAATVLLVPTARARVLGTTPFAETTVSGRVVLWQETLALVLQNPQWGVGPSRFVDAIGAQHDARWAATVGPYAPPDSPHNVVLQVAAAAGVPGLLVILVFAVLVARRLWRLGSLDAWQAGAVTACLGAMATYMVAFTEPTTTPVCCLLLGSALAVPRAGAARQASARAWVAAALALLVGGWYTGTIWVSEASYTGALRTGRPEVLLEASAAQRPWDVDHRRRVAYTMVRLVEEGLVPPARAAEFTERLCDPLPGSVECLLVVADAQDLAGRPDAALETLAAARVLDATNLDTLLKEGIALAGLGRYPEAEAAFRRAADLRPSAVEPWQDLVQLYTLQGRTADADAARAHAAEILARR